MQYKVVPFSAAVSHTQNASAVAAQIEEIIKQFTAAGWEFTGVHQLQTFKAGNGGCFGFGATPPATLTSEFVIFRK